MYRQIGLALLILTPFISFSQEEKGCGIFKDFTVVTRQMPEGTINVEFLCSGTYVVGSFIDSVFIEINEDMDVIMNWSLKDELNFGFPSLFDSPIEWYRNDSLLDPSEFVVEDYFNSGACGTQHKASARLDTRLPGFYQLRKTHTYVDLPVIVLYEKAADIEEIEELSLKIYPNPTSDVLYIGHGEVNYTEVMLQSIDGNSLVQPKLERSGGTTRIDISHLASGSYILTFSSDKHETVRKKINVI